MASLSLKEAAHLLRRMGFGGTSGDIDALVGKERETAVNSLIDYETVNNQEMVDSLARSFLFLRLSSSSEITNANFNETEIRAWWITRLLTTKRPFEEKMTLFWHNHFATSLDTVPAIQMYTQNLYLRKYALGRFDDLLLNISEGAAMLIWLNGVESNREAPNENFARELLELFTMGTNDVVTDDPNYSEGDVKDVARAFAGWRFRIRNDDLFANEWYVDTNSADSGAKTIFGQTANFSGEDVIMVLADKQATARFLVYKLFNFFVYPLDLNNQTDKQTIDKFANVYLRKNHSIKELTRAIFQSDEFFSQRAVWGMVKNPVEYAVGTRRMLNLHYLVGTFDNREVTLQASLKEMGMNLFAPPNVAGWKTDLGFINTETLLARYNFSDALMFGFLAVSAAFDQDIQKYIKPSVKKTVAKLVNAMGLELDQAVIKDLQQYLTLDKQGNAVSWPPDGGLVSRMKIRGLIRLMMCLPEYQLN